MHNRKDKEFIETAEANASIIFELVYMQPLSGKLVQSPVLENKRKNWNKQMEEVRYTLIRYATDIQQGKGTDDRYRFIKESNKTIKNYMRFLSTLKGMIK